MFCSNCGKELFDTARFCPFCGITLIAEKEVPAAGPVQEMPKAEAPVQEIPKKEAPKKEEANKEKPKKERSNKERSNKEAKTRKAEKQKREKRPLKRSTMILLTVICLLLTAAAVTACILMARDQAVEVPPAAAEVPEAVEAAPELSAVELPSPAVYLGVSNDPDYGNAQGRYTFCMQLPFDVIGAEYCTMLENEYGLEIIEDYDTDVGHECRLGQQGAEDVLVGWTFGEFYNMLYVHFADSAVPVAAQVYESAQEEAAAELSQYADMDPNMIAELIAAGELEGYEPNVPDFGAYTGAMLISDPEIPILTYVVDGEEILGRCTGYIHALTKDPLYPVELKSHDSYVNTDGDQVHIYAFQPKPGFLCTEQEMTVGLGGGVTAEADGALVVALTFGTEAFAEVSIVSAPELVFQDLGLYHDPAQPNPFLEALM